MQAIQFWLLNLVLLYSKPAIPRFPVYDDILGFTRIHAGIKPTIGAYETELDYAGPKIIYDKLMSSSSLTSRSLTANIYDVLGKVDDANGPYLYYKKPSQTNDSLNWIRTSGTKAGNNYTFALDYTKIGGATINDTIQYFIIAQDTAKPANYTITSGSISGTFKGSNLNSSKFLY